jgi:hypothetical protein
VQTEQITHDERKLRFAIIEHEAAGVQLVVDVRAWIRRKASHDLASKFRRDVARRGTRLERRISGMKRSYNEQ